MITKKRRTEKGDSRQNMFFAIFIGLLFFGIIGFLFVSDWRITQKREELLNKIESLRKEVQTLEEKNQQLQAGISQTENDAYWEEKAREQGYKKPGEEAVVVLPPEENAQATAEKQKSFWENILEKLGL